MTENNELPNGEGTLRQELKPYLVGKPSTYCCSPTGRATRGYVAYSVHHKHLVFLKDAWRANCDEIHPEIETYTILNRKGVCYVPTALGGGDVGSPSPQRTITQRYLEESDAPLERLHSRLILKELGRPLDTYTDSAELMLVVAYAFEGMQGSFVHCCCSPRFQATVLPGRKRKSYIATSAWLTF